MKDEDLHALLKRMEALVEELQALKLLFARIATPVSLRGIAEPLIPLDELDAAIEAAKRELLPSL